MKKIPMKQGLGEKLRQAMNDLTADVWGMEVKAVRGLSDYFHARALSEKRSPELYTIRITNADGVRAELFYDGLPVCELSMNDLLPILGAPTFYRPDQEKTAAQVSRYLDSLATQFRVSAGEVAVCLSVENTVYALLHPSDEEHAITFPELLRFFTK